MSQALGWIIVLQAPEARMFKKLFSQKLGFKIALASVAIGLVGLVFSSYQVYAANITAGVLNISFDGDQLFSETNMAPGDVVVKNLTVTNTGTLPHSFSMAASNVTGDLANVIQIEPRENGRAFWNETLSALASLPKESKVIISSIDPGATRNLQIAAIFPSSVGNNYQNKSVANFSFRFGNESTDQPEPTVNSSPPVALGTTGTGTTGTTGGTTGGVAGEGVQSEDQVDTSDTGQSTLGTTGDGAKGATTTARDLCFWWIVILIILIAFLAMYHRYIKGERPAFWWFWPIVMALFLFFVQLFFDRHYQPTVFCRWFWALEAGVLVIYYIIENYIASKELSE